MTIGYAPEKIINTWNHLDLLKRRQEDDEILYV